MRVRVGLGGPRWARMGPGGPGYQEPLLAPSGFQAGSGADSRFLGKPTPGGRFSAFWRPGQNYCQNRSQEVDFQHSGALGRISVKTE